MAGVGRREITGQYELDTVSLESLSNSGGGLAISHHSGKSVPAAEEDRCTGRELGVVDQEHDTVSDVHELQLDEPFDVS